MSKILPVHGLKFYRFKTPIRHQSITLIKEEDNKYDKYAIAAYNIYNEKIGYISAQKNRNKILFNSMKTDKIIAKAWNVTPSEILVEIESI